MSAVWTSGGWRRRYAVTSGPDDARPMYFRSLDEALITFAYFNETPHCRPGLFVWRGFPQDWAQVIPLKGSVYDHR